MRWFFVGLFVLVPILNLALGKKANWKGSSAPMSALSNILCSLWIFLFAPALAFPSLGLLWAILLIATTLALVFSANRDCRADRQDKPKAVVTRISN
jgi:hypothetical protein